MLQHVQLMCMCTERSVNFYYIVFSWMCRRRQKQQRRAVTATASNIFQSESIFTHTAKAHTYTHITIHSLLISYNWEEIAYFAALHIGAKQFYSGAERLISSAVTIANSSSISNCSTIECAIRWPNELKKSDVINVITLLLIWSEFRSSLHATNINMHMVTSNFDESHHFL